MKAKRRSSKYARSYDTVAARQAYSTYMTEVFYQMKLMTMFLQIKKVEQLLYSTFKGNKATHYGTENEKTTRQQYHTYMQQNGHPNLNVQARGLFVSLENLMACLVHDPDTSQPLGLVEIKNPYSLCTTPHIGRSHQEPYILFRIQKYDTYTLK